MWLIGYRLYQGEYVIPDEARLHMDSRTRPDGLGRNDKGGSIVIPDEARHAPKFGDP